MISRMLHPNDYNGMDILQTIYNHSDSKTTQRYIGLTKKETDSYYDDMGTFFDDYITGNKTYKEVVENPIITLDVNDLRDIIAVAYKAGIDNSGKTDAMSHIETINEIISTIEQFSK